MKYLTLISAISLSALSLFGDTYNIATQNGKTVTNSVVKGVSTYTRLGKLSSFGSLVLTDLGFTIFLDEVNDEIGIDLGGSTNYLCTVEAAENQFLKKTARINGIPLSNNNITLTHTMLGAAPLSITNQVNLNTRTVQLWETYWGGSNLVMEVTNYYNNTSGELPKLRLLELIGRENGNTNYSEWTWNPSAIPDGYDNIAITNCVFDSDHWYVQGSYTYNDEEIGFSKTISGAVDDLVLEFILIEDQITIAGTRTATPDKDYQYEEIWNDSDKFEMHAEYVKTNIVANAIHTCMTNCESKIEKKADKAWGKYTSAGGEAPTTNIVYMTAPTTYFAGGLEFEKVAVGNGAISVLVTKGAQAYTYGMEGQFRIGDASGTDYFGYNKTESYTVGTTTDGISVNGTMVCLTYHIIASTYPIIYYTETLDSPNWVQLNDLNGDPAESAPYAVTFDDSTPGTYLAYINCGDNPSGFFKAETAVVGECVFVTSMMFDPMGGIKCTNVTAGATIHNVTIIPKYNNGTVTWELKK